MVAGLSLFRIRFSVTSFFSMISLFLAVPGVSNSRFPPLLFLQFSSVGERQVMWSVEGDWKGGVWLFFSLYPFLSVFSLTWTHPSQVHTPTLRLYNSLPLDAWCLKLFSFSCYVVQDTLPLGLSYCSNLSWSVKSFTILVSFLACKTLYCLPFCSFCLCGFMPFLYNLVGY